LIEDDMVEHFERRILRRGRRVGPLIYVWDVLNFIRCFTQDRFTLRVIPNLTAPFSRSLHYPAIYLLLALSYLMPTPTAFQGYLAFVLAGVVGLALLLEILIRLGKIRPDAYWGKAGGNFMLAFFATLCFVNLFLVELTLEQWAHAYGFTLGLMQVFILRWLWPQLFDQDSDWAKKQREPTVLKIPRETAGSDFEP
jgi:hypothetical protein